MKYPYESIVLEFLQSIKFPGIRQCEGNREICSYLIENNYVYTPDLVVGPQNIRDTQIENLFFIDIIEPTTDLLFESKFYKGSPFDVPNEFGICCIKRRISESLALLIQSPIRIMNFI